MEVLSSLLLLAFIVFVLLAIFTAMQKATAMSLFGLLLMLLSPIAAALITSSAPTFQEWTATLRTVGTCVFVWGLVESVLPALRSKNETSNATPSREDEKTIRR